MTEIKDPYVTFNYYNSLIAEQNRLTGDLWRVEQALERLYRSEEWKIWLGEKKTLERV